MRFKNLLPTQAKLKIYKVFILPRITYCHMVWYHCLSSDERKLERVQERALKVIYCDKNSSYAEFLKS